MIEALINNMRLQAQRAIAQSVTTRLALITNYSPDNYCAKVQLQPENTTTGWLPVASVWVGNGWGAYSPPSINELVSITFFDGDPDTGFVQARLYNNQDAPLSVPSGELWFVHKSGQSVKLTNDGKLTLSDGQGAIVALNGDGSMTSQATQWNHTGPITVNGEVTANGIPLSTHLHPVKEVQTGSSTIDTDVPIA